MNIFETASSSDPERPNFENLKCELVDNSDNMLLDNSFETDVNFFNLKTQNLDSPYRNNFKNSLRVLPMIYFQYFI